MKNIHFLLAALHNFLNLYIPFHLLYAMEAIFEILLFVSSLYY
jgi:hypothetical protein